MSYKVSLFSLITFVLFAACTSDSKPVKVEKPKKNPAIEKLFSEVMEVHDEVMPEMGTIHDLRKSFEEKLTVAEGDQKANIELMIESLNQADNAMMDWMQQFKMPKEKSDEDKIDYLTKQKAKIDKVSVSMKSTIESAKKAINEL